MGLLQYLNIIGTLTLMPTKRVNLIHYFYLPRTLPLCPHNLFRHVNRLNNQLINLFVGAWDMGLALL